MCSEVWLYLPIPSTWPGSSFLIEKYMQAIQTAVSTVSITQFWTKPLIFTKNTGTTPKNRPMVVKPKASPGARGRTDTRTASVTYMVMLKSSTPKRDIYILLSPKSRKGRARSRLSIAVRFTPSKSLKNPPSALPMPIKEKSIMV